MNDCIERTCAFTGHRPEKLEYKESHVTTWLEDMIWQAVNDGYTAFMSGMQRGVDLWAAEAVLRSKSKVENIRLVVVSAFKDMGNDWSDDWKEKYNYVLSKADEVVFVSAEGSKEAFTQRDHYMVDHASRLIAVYGGVKGGTKETIEYAKTKDIEIVMYSDDPDTRWDAHFGEPTTDVFKTKDFLDWFDDVMKFD